MFSYKSKLLKRLINNNNNTTFLFEPVFKVQSPPVVRFPILSSLLPLRMIDRCFGVPFVEKGALIHTCIRTDRGDSM